MILVETLVPALAGLLLFSFCGWALTGWLLPGAPGGLRWAALPWTGYAAFVVLAQFATQAGLNMGQTALLALVLAALANGLYGLRARRAALWRRAGWHGTGMFLAAGTALVFLLGVLPLLFYGYSTIIGENWDGEIYLALGQYLQQYAQPALAQAPGNPLLTTLLVPPYGVRTHGFSYAQAAVSALTGLPSLATLSPMLALLRALAVPATYFFFRAGWGWAPRPALLAALVLGLNPFLLWITYNTFGMQVPSLGLLPLAVGATLLALRAAGDPALMRNADGEMQSDEMSGRSAIPLPRWAAISRLAGYAALTTAALAVTYHPALTAWLALAGAGGLAVLLGSGRRWPRVVGAGIGVGVGAAALSAVAQWLSFGGFLTQYADQTPGLGLTTFTAPTDGLGLSLSFRTLLAAGPGQALLARVVQGYQALIVLGGLICAGLAVLWLVRVLRQREAGRWVQAATFAGSLAYLLVFVRPLDYVYGWFKAQSFVGFVLVGAVVGGAAWLVEHPARAHVRGLSVSALPVAVPIAALLVTLGLLLWQYHWPLRYSAEMIAAGQVRDYVRPGDVVLVSNSRLMPGRLFNGLLAYFLRDSRLYGTFATANSQWNQLRPDGVYTWAVLPEHELPQPYGYRPSDQAWANGLLALYHAPADLRYVQSWDRKGDYPRATTAAPLNLQAQPDRVTLGKEPVLGGTAVSRTLELGVAVFATQTLQVGITSQNNLRQETVQLAPGLQQLTVGLDAPAVLRLLPASGSDVAAVRWVTLRDGTARGAAPQVEAPLPNVLMLNVASQAQGSNVQTTLQRVDTRSPDKQADRVVLDVYRAGGGGGEADHFGYWSFALTGPAATFQVPLAGGTPAGGPGATPLPDASRRGAVRNGRFSASLTFYRGSNPLDSVTDIYTFDAQQGADGALVITNIAIRALPLLFY